MTQQRYTPAPERHKMTDEQQAEAAATTRDHVPTARAEKHEETLAHTDDLLDEIDEALEGLEAQQVVAGNVQKGGQ